MTTLQQVELGVLGPLRVRQYGLPVAIPGAKPRAILTMLGLHGGSVVSADTLVELLWGDESPRTAVKALQTHVSALRRALGDGFVLTEGAGWTLSTDEIDATRYKLASRLGRAAMTAGDPSQATTRFNEAVALWRGVPELLDNPRGVSEATRWFETHAALVEDRADALLETGRAAELIGELEAAIGEAPLRERRWGHLMLALYRAGRQGEALGAYRRARSLLADELGVDPGPELRRLEAAIVAQDAALEMTASQQLSVVTRAVTFLLTDIEGSTAAWEADADAMAVALARHDEVVEQVVTSRAGRLIKTRGEGDATFSVFDRPSAAAAAAIDLQEAIRQEPWALAEPMRIRVALHTGEVELRDGDYFGRAVNRAARLRSLAAGGQILCSGATAELVIDSLSDDVVLADLGMRQLKNLARPEHVFELRLETADDARALPSDVPVERPGLPAVLAGPGPFVGRGPELERLFSAWHTTLDAGTRAVLIAGEPGVGKTRLAGEWSRQAYEQGAFVLYGRCDEDLAAPYQPFAEALRSLLPCLGEQRLRGLRGVEALLSLVPGLGDVLPDLAAPPRADPDTERYALFDAVVAVLGIATASAPVVLILDDLHWATKPTLLLLRHLLRFGEQARVQIVGTYRSTDLDRSHPLAAMLADLHRDGTATRLQLDGLDQDDVTAYVTEAGYDDEELARALASVTGGNPFFLIEALRHVDESGGRWDPSTLPQGVREAVSRRLSRLPSDTNKALAAAAVVGSRFALALVESVIGDDLVDAFDEATKAGIVIEEPGGNYRFNHAIVRQSLLAELASVRRMRLHQKIAATLEAESGSDDELLAELAYHYFECAWAGNAGKAVEYCRRAADQAMMRLAYEGAADLYDKALHALEELDEELPDRDDLQAELLVARCEALLAAGDVVSAAGAVKQLQDATSNSDRLAAWGTCFDGQLSMLTDPERLDEIEAALGAAAAKLAALNDAAGEAKAHTVRAGCLARLGRIGDSETALDQALTAARRAREHRRVNAVLAGAPLAALWGPNPVPRAGGRCLDVVRLLRITTGSPVVEATSTRCQGVLDAFRGRATAGRQLIDSARRTLTELGTRHALLEVEQFAGIVELVADDPLAAEPHLRRAYNGFRRMGLDADTAETAALLARACLLLDKDDEADELCTESEHLAGHALKASIAWRTARALLLARNGAHADARRVAEEAVDIAGRTDALVDHGDACFTLATVLDAAGDAVGARVAADKAIELYDLKGAAALAEKARSILGVKVPVVPVAPDAPGVEPDTACVRAVRRIDAAFRRQAWDEVGQQVATVVISESRRKIVGFPRIELPASDWAREARRYLDVDPIRHRHVVVAARGERLALTRLSIGTSDEFPGAPQDEMLQLFGLDEDGRIEVQVWFDPEDLDAAIAELDSAHARLELDNACVHVGSRVVDAVNREAWEEVAQLFAPRLALENRRKIVGFSRIDLPPERWTDDMRRYLQTGLVRYRFAPIAVRGDRLALVRMDVGTADLSSGAPQDEMIQVIGIDAEGLIALQVSFDVEDIDAATAELDAAYARFERQPSRVALDNAATRVADRMNGLFIESRWDEFGECYADELRVEDRRRGLRRDSSNRVDEVANIRAVVDLGIVKVSASPMALRGNRLCLNHVTLHGREGFGAEALVVMEVDADERLVTQIALDPDDFDAAIAELDALYVAGEAVAHAHTWSVVAGVYAALSRREFPATSPDWVNIDHRRAAIAQGEMIEFAHAAWEDSPDLRVYAEVVHRLSDFGAVVSHLALGTSHETFDAEWREIDVIAVDGDLVSRGEIFEESDLDAALARFDELSHVAPKLENAASRVAERLNAAFSARDWAAMSDLLTDDSHSHDRRRVIGGLSADSRDAVVEIHRGVAEFGIPRATSMAVATRSQRLALVVVRYSLSDNELDNFEEELLQIVEIDADDRAVARITFDLDDFEAAVAELDALYVAGEAAAHAHAWSLIAPTAAGFNRHELASTTNNLVTTDHRRVAAFEPGGLAAYIHAGWDGDAGSATYIESVHRLSDLGAVVTYAGSATSREGFEAEWRVVDILTIDGELIDRCELFDESDLDAALARFDELSRPARRLDNAASVVYERLWTYFEARNWDELAEITAVDISLHDRRRPVNGGIRHGRDAEIANLRAIAQLGVTNVRPTVIATRGGRLALHRVRMSNPDEGFHIEVLGLVGVDAHERIVTIGLFDCDDVDPAFAELEARYLTGEAAAHAHAWSVVARTYAEFNRHDYDPSSVENIDHRRVARYAPGDLTPANTKITPDLRSYVEAVHRLGDRGAVVTCRSQGTSQDGFEAEWKLVLLQTVERDVMTRSEMFDETDLDAAIARFDELEHSATQLENAASRMYKSYNAHFAARNWDAMSETIADDIWNEDRRRVVNGGIQRGRDAVLTNMRAVADVGVKNIELSVIATRGDRLALVRQRISGDRRPEAFGAEVLIVAEADADNRLVAGVAFDLDDVDAAFAELEARYVAGEAAPYADTWSVIVRAHAAFNRHELPPTTPSWVNIDHRRGSAFAAGDLTANIRASWDITPDISFYIETVHRLTDLGVVVGSATNGTSQLGFDAEWRQTNLLTLKGDRISRCEIFEETDIDKATAAFDQLNRPAPQLENAASRLAQRYQTCFNTRDWTGMTEMLANDMVSDDRRRVVNAGVRRGGDLQIADTRAATEVGAESITSTVLAIRGERLTLNRVHTTNRGLAPGEFGAEMLGILERDAANRIAATVAFDLVDIDAAFAELDARYVAGEAAAHANTWSLVTQTYTAFNRQELSTTTPDWVNIDHRRGVGSEPGDMNTYVSAMWSVVPDVSTRIEAVHRLSNLGAVFTHTERGASQAGFDAEWREVALLTFDGDMINRCEVFDEADLDAALARFDELSRPGRLLDNTASQVNQQFWGYFAASDWDALGTIVADDVVNEDRRRIVNSGIHRGREANIADMRAISEVVGAVNITPTITAVRGERLALTRIRSSNRWVQSDEIVAELLCLVEIDSDNRVVAQIGFDLDDADAAFAELDARYLAGEAAAHAHTWSVIARGHARYNRRELPATTRDWVNIDHRRGRSFEPGDLNAYIRVTWEDTPNGRTRIAAVHRLSDLGAVVTTATHGTSSEGFDAEWSQIDVVTIEGELFNRSETFDETDLDAALARFDELSQLKPRLENEATRAYDRFQAHFIARDFDAMAQMLTHDHYSDDRRPVVGAGMRRGADAEIEDLQGVSAQFTEFATSADVIATRGDLLALYRARFSGYRADADVLHWELLGMVEAEDDGRVKAFITLDPADLDAAFAALDAQYGAGEGAAHGETWAVIAGAFDGLNRREFPVTPTDFINVDHRRGAPHAPGDLFAYIRTAWDLTPGRRHRLEAIHQLADVGAVFDAAAYGTTTDGFDVEWRMTVVGTVEGGLLSRIEIFDEADIEGALARFEELTA